MEALSLIHILKNRIRELRERLGLTQEQLGELVGASRQAVNAIETEKFEPSIWLAYDPVSSTHLDVYKRHIFRAEQKKCPGTRQKPLFDLLNDRVREGVMSFSEVESPGEFPVF